MKVLVGIMVLFLGVVNANAAPLNLNPDYPNLAMWSADYTYDYTKNGPDAGGLFEIDLGTSAIALDPDGTGWIPITTPAYHLEANFDVSGNFEGGTLSATGTTSHPEFQSGTIYPIKKRRL